MVEDPIWNKWVIRSFLKVRVAVDVEKPLVAGFWVSRGDKRMVWAEVRYEKIVDFYFGCGRLGHVLKNCEEGMSLPEEVEGKMKYGLWMKVAPIRATEKGKWKENKKSEAGYKDEEKQGKEG